MAKETKMTNENDIKASTVAFTPERMDIVSKMIEASRGSSTQKAISRYTDFTDPKKIRKVKVSRFNNKYVLGFKDLNLDPYRKEPKYSQDKFDSYRNLNLQPHVTLLLSDDGKKVEETEVSLISYMDRRTQVECDVVEIKSKEIIEDKGLLGKGGTGGYATAVSESGAPVAPTTVKAEVLRIERVYVVNVPGFEKPVEFIEAFLA